MLFNLYILRANSDDKLMIFFMQIVSQFCLLPFEEGYIENSCTRNVNLLLSLHLYIYNCQMFKSSLSVNFPL